MSQVSLIADNKNSQQGFIPVFKRRFKRYGTLALGQLVALMGNRIRVDGMVFSIDSPIIKTVEKCGLYFESHEPDERALLNNGPPRDLPVVEFGGGIGVISCVTNRKLAKPENHIVVEANPDLVPLLERNRDLNGCRFRVVHKALAYDAAEVRFNYHWSLFGGGLDSPSEKSVSVPSTSLKAIADAAGFDKFSVICDVEGAEAALVEREIDTLRERVRFLLVEIHPDIIKDEGASRLLQRLLDAGFILRGQCHRNWAFTHD